MDGNVDAPKARGDPSASELDARYAKETNRLLLERLRLTATVGAPVHLIFWGLDAFEAPEHMITFLVLRIIGAASCLLALAGTYVEAGRRWLVPLSVLPYAVVSLVIVAMTAFLGGFTSHYYIGIMLVLFLAGLLMPWSTSAAVALAGIVSGGYLTVNLIVWGHSIAAIAPTSFLLGTSGFMVLAVSSARRARQRELALLLRVERANDELRRLDESKTRFFANVSHELRTPLTLILGPLESMLARDTDGYDREALEAMRSAGGRLLRQVNMLLDFARIESDTVRVDRRRANLGTILADLVRAASPYAQKRGTELVTEGLEDLPDTEFDPDHLETVAANLLSNALKFTPAGRIAVRAEVTGDRVHLEVRDTGVGIPADHLDSIFERFHQVDDQKIETGQAGTGLGLSLARELVRLHGGDINVESTLGHGSSFHVTLPIKAHPIAERRASPRRRADRFAQAKIEMEVAREYTQHRGRTALLSVLEEGDRAADPISTADLQGPPSAPRVLLVEDNPDLLAFVARELVTEFRIRTARDGLAGLEAARREAPDLIVTDVLMPRMSGLEMCRKLREDAGLRRVPIIILTAKSGTDSIIEGLAGGAVDYMTKPFDARELRARIHAHLREVSLERTLDERETRLAAIGQMTSALVHDMRTPANTIGSYAELALMGLDGTPAGTEEIADDIKEIKRASQRMGRMLQEMLDFARGEHRMVTSPTPIDQFLEMVAQEFENSLAGVGIELILRTEDAKRASVPMDTSRLLRAFENLLGNARDALAGHENADQTKRIWLDAFRDGSEIVVRVADNGPGVPADLRAELFDPFVTRHKATGTGLGLAIARNVIAAHQGTLELEDQPAEGGAAFRIRFSTGGGNQETSSHPEIAAPA